MLPEAERTWVGFAAGNRVDLFPLGKGTVALRMVYNTLVPEIPR